MRLFFQNLAVSFGMYSKIPMPHFEWNEKNMRYAMCFFPFIGAVLGGITIGVYFLLGYIGLGRMASAAVMVVLPIIITGGIHIDGLLDTADAISSYQTRERRLEILKDSHAGAFAIIFGIGYFILDYGFKTELDLRSVLLVAVGYMLSRALSALAVVSFNCASKSGLVKTFSDSAAKKAVQVSSIIYMLIAAALMLYISPVVGAICIVMTALVFLYYRLMSYSRFGGINGDLAGYFVQVCELFILMAAVIGGRVCF